MRTIFAAIAVLALSVPPANASDAREGRDWQCGRFQVMVYADKYREPRPLPPFKNAFWIVKHGEAVARLPSRFFTLKDWELYYRGKRCTALWGEAEDDPSPDVSTPVLPIPDELLEQARRASEARRPVVRAVVPEVVPGMQGPYVAPGSLNFAPGKGNR
jgi:hypothetical protein